MQTNNSTIKFEVCCPRVQAHSIRAILSSFIVCVVTYILDIFFISFMIKISSVSLWIKNNIRQNANKNNIGKTKQK